MTNRHPHVTNLLHWLHAVRVMAQDQIDRARGGQRLGDSQLALIWLCHVFLAVVKTDDDYLRSLIASTLRIDNDPIRIVGIDAPGISVFIQAIRISKVRNLDALNVEYRDDP